METQWQTEGTIFVEEDAYNYEKRMQEYVQSDEWKNYDEKLRPNPRGVYLCLNMNIPTQDSVQDRELMYRVKELLVKHKIRYNPFNLTIDAIAPNGVNTGVVVDECDFDKIMLDNDFAIANAIKQGRQFRPEEWEGKELKFDCREEGKEF